MGEEKHKDHQRERHHRSSILISVMAMLCVIATMLMLTTTSVILADPGDTITVTASGTLLGNGTTLNLSMTFPEGFTVESWWVVTILAFGMLIIAYEVLRSFYCKILSGALVIGAGIFVISEEPDVWAYTIMGMAFAAVGFYVLMMVAYDFARGEAQYEY